MTTKLTCAILVAVLWIGAETLDWFPTACSIISACRSMTLSTPPLG